MMGWEGVFGLIMSTLILIIGKFIGSPFTDHIDDLALAYEQMSNNYSLIMLALGFIIAAACFNGLGVYTIKMTSAANKTVAE